jgi:CheY-like chemotaxis protein
MAVAKIDILWITAVLGGDGDTAASGRSPNPQPATDSLPPLNEQRDVKRLILCIEDNPANLALVRAILDVRPNIELISALQGQLGIDLARKHLPALILLDLHLPDLTGQEVLAKLRSNEDTRHIPVVVTSADASPGRIKALLEQGADAYLTKPLDIIEFCRVVDEQINQRP